MEIENDFGRIPTENEPLSNVSDNFGWPPLPVSLKEGLLDAVSQNLDKTFMGVDVVHDSPSKTTLPLSMKDAFFEAETLLVLSPNTNFNYCQIYFREDTNILGLMVYVSAFKGAYAYIMENTQRHQYNWESPSVGMAFGISNLKSKPSKIPFSYYGIDDNFKGTLGLATHLQTLTNRQMLNLSVAFLYRQIMSQDEMMEKVSVINSLFS